jgi:DNA-binding NarL/FixJ family response regulator
MSTDGAVPTVSTEASRRIEIAVVAEERADGERLLFVLRAGGLQAVARSSVETLIESGPAPEVIVVLLRHDEEGVERLRACRERFPESQFVCIARGLDWRAARALFRAGAHGLVEEVHVDDALEAAVRSVHAGQLTLPNELRGQMAEPTLSVREKQILAMVVMGFSNPEIAAKLFVAESTVKSHLSSAFSKLGVRSRNEATALILDPAHGLGTGILEISGETKTPPRRPAARRPRTTAGKY